MRSFFARKEPPCAFTIRLTLDDQASVQLVNDLTAELADALGGMTPEGRAQGSLLLGEDVRLLRQDAPETLRKGVLVMSWTSLTEKGARALRAIAPRLEHLRVQP